MIQDIIKGYDYEKISIGVIGSHSALDVLDGAKRTRFKTTVICEKGREEPYTRHDRIIDNLIILDKFSDIYSVQEELREENCIFIPNRSFAVYCDTNRIEKEFQIPLFGSRDLLKVEERVGPHNYYKILDIANIRYPKVFKSPEEIECPVICKIPHATQEVERGFFVAKSKEDFFEEFNKRIESGTIKKSDLAQASIEEFISGVTFNFNIFYSPIYNRTELMGIDRRFVTDLDGVVRLPANQQIKLEFEEEMKEIGNYAVTLRESMLRHVYPMADNFVAATKKLYSPGIIGPFALQTMITKNYEFIVFDVSMRMGGGTNSFMGIWSQYSAVYWGEPISAGKRVGMEIKRAVEQNRLQYIVT